MAACGRWRRVSPRHQPPRDPEDRDHAARASRLRHRLVPATHGSCGTPRRCTSRPAEVSCRARPVTATSGLTLGPRTGRATAESIKFLSPTSYPDALPGMLQRTSSTLHQVNGPAWSWTRRISSDHRRSRVCTSACGRPRANVFHLAQASDEEFEGFWRVACDIAALSSAITHARM